jgi:hypothetical protein
MKQMRRFFIKKLYRHCGTLFCVYGGSAGPNNGKCQGEYNDLLVLFETESKTRLFGGFI